jgi:hypothetical protein
MSYLEEMTSEQYISNIKSRDPESNITSLNQFDEFCKDSFEKEGYQVILDLKSYQRDSKRFQPIQVIAEFCYLIK